MLVIEVPAKREAAWQASDVQYRLARTSIVNI
jgi:hypothetical protein